MLRRNWLKIEAIRMLTPGPFEDGIGNATFIACPQSVSLVGGRAQELVLSAYRLPWNGRVCFWLDIKLDRELCFAHLQEGFRHTGGVPQFLFVRAVRPFGRMLGDSAAWSRSFERFCAYYGCHPLPWRR